MHTNRKLERRRHQFHIGVSSKSRRDLNYSKDRICRFLGEREKNKQHRSDEIDSVEPLVVHEEVPVEGLATPRVCRELVVAEPFLDEDGCFSVVEFPHSRIAARLRVRKRVEFGGFAMRRRFFGRFCTFEGRVIIVR